MLMTIFEAVVVISGMFTVTAAALSAVGWVFEKVEKTTAWAKFKEWCEIVWIIFNVLFWGVLGLIGWMLYRVGQRHIGGHHDNYKRTYRLRDNLQSRGDIGR
jgi:hypothetical protein